MTELLSSDQMRAIEGAAIASGSVTGLELMERAGSGVVEAIFEEWSEYAEAPRRAVILCGPGNNGGDGFVVARLLAEQHWEVDVFLYGDREKLPPDAKTNCERWALIGSIKPLTVEGIRAEHPVHGHTNPDIYLDALFGTGLKRAVSNEARNVLQFLAEATSDDDMLRIVSVDAPSGLCMDSGKVLTDKTSDRNPPPVISPKRPADNAPFTTRFAALTVAFDSPKIGHFIGDGPRLCGKLVVKDIGIEGWRCFQPREARSAEEPRQKYREGGDTRVVRTPDLQLISAKPLVADRRGLTGVPIHHLFDTRAADIHKFNRGSALILSGPAGQTGAARLAARGALRVGAGLVTVAAPGAAMMECAGQLTAIMLRQCDGPDDLVGLLQDDRLSGLCLGPGLGVGEETRALVGAALAMKRPTVLDADALTSFTADPRQLFAQLHESCVLTPHAGEFARLFPDIAARLAALPVSGPAYSKVDATKAAADAAGCVVLFKGPDTVVASPGGLCAIHSAHYDRATPWLATAGAGDVLAGFITGLLARGVGSDRAAELAAWLHVECARRIGPGLIAEDLPESLPAVLAALLSHAEAAPPTL